MAEEGVIIPIDFDVRDADQSVDKLVINIQKYLKSIDTSKLTSAMRNTVASTENQIVKLNQAIDAADRYRESTAHISDAYKSLGAEITEQGRQLTTYRESLEKLEKKKAIGTKEVKTDEYIKATESLERMREKSSQLARQFAMLRSASDGYGADIVIATNTHKEAMKELTVTLTALQDAQKRLNPASAEYATIQKQIASVSSQINSEEKQFSATILNLTKGLASQEAEMKRVQKSYGGLQGRIKQTETAMSKMAQYKTVKLSNSEIQQLDEDLLTAQDNIDRTVAKIATLEAQLRRMENKGTDTEYGPKLETLDEKVDSYRLKLVQLVEKLDAYARKEQEAAEASANAGNSSDKASKGAKKTANAYNKAHKSMRKTHVITKALSKAFNNLSRSMSNANKNSKNFFKDMNKSLRRGLTTIMRYVFGFRTLFYLVRAIRKAMLESLKLMAKTIPEVNDDISQILTAFYQLKGTLGTLAQPILSSLMPAIRTLLNGLASVITMLSKFVALLTGQNYIYKATAANVDYAKSANKASGAQKELNKQLGHYDELHVITDDDKNGGGGGADDLFEDSVKWEKEAIEATDFVKKLKLAIEMQDWTGLGKAIGEHIRDMLNSINWSKIKQKAAKLGRALAELLNGIFETNGLGLTIGHTLAEAFNTGIEFLYNFVTNFNWKAFGKFLSDIVMGFFNWVNWAKLGKTLGDLINGIAHTAITFLDETDWKSIGKKIGNLINNFFNPESGENPLANVGEMIGKAINAAADVAISFLQETDWKDIGTKIGEFINKIFDPGNGENPIAKLGSLLGEAFDALGETVSASLSETDFNKIGETIVSFIHNFFNPESGNNPLGTIAEVIEKCIQGAIDAWKGAFNVHPFETALVTAFGVLTFTGLGTKLATAIKTAVSTALTAAATALGTTAGTMLCASLIAAVVGFGLGKALGKALDPEASEFYNNFHWFGDDGFFAVISEDWGTTGAALAQMLLDNLLKGFGADKIKEGWERIKEGFNQIIENIKELFSPDDNKDLLEIGVNIIKGIAKGFVGVLEIVQAPIVEFFDTVMTAFKNVFGIHSPARAMKPIGCNILLGVIDGFKSKFEEFKKTVQDFFDNNIKPWFTKEKWDEIFSGMHSSMEKMQEKVCKIFEDLKDLLKEPINAIIGMIEGFANLLVAGINAVVTALNEFKVDIPKIEIMGNTLYEGNTLGFNIPQLPEVSIPRLAEGAVIPANNEFLAMLGDQKHGTNIEAPLDTIKQALAEVMTELGANSNSNIPTVVLQLNSKTVAEAVWDEEDKRYKQTGRR